jgi:hypothetical protein
MNPERNIRMIIFVNLAVTNTNSLRVGRASVRILNVKI